MLKKTLSTQDVPLASRKRRRGTHRITVFKALFKFFEFLYVFLKIGTVIYEFFFKKE
jgi:hypothetical protein